MAKSNVTCPNCRARYSVDDSSLGKRSKCAKCGTAFVLAREASGTASPVRSADPATPSPHVRGPAAGEPAVAGSNKAAQSVCPAASQQQNGMEKHDAEPSINRPPLPILCSNCRSRHMVASGQLGHTMTCDKCNAAFVVADLDISTLPSTFLGNPTHYREVFKTAALASAYRNKVMEAAGGKITLINLAMTFKDHAETSSRGYWQAGVGAQVARDLCRGRNESAVSWRAPATCRR